MRKLTTTVLLISALVLSGCGNSAPVQKHGNDQTTGVADILASASESAAEVTETPESTDGPAETSDIPVISETDISSEETNPYDISSRLANGAEGVDIDLTVLSSNMVYSEVFAMVYSPEDYLGKTVKMEGLFSYMHNDANDKTYYACVVQDATQCCAQGIEFVPTEDYAYPDDFPGIGENICVIGVFDTYMEDGAQYLTLRDAVLVKSD